MRETTKQVKVMLEDNEETFQIRKMDALSGSFLMKFCVEKLLPVFNGMKNIFSPVEEGADAEKVVADRTNQVLAMLPVALSSISETELTNFEIKCLQTVDMLTPGGWTTVMTNGKFDIEELEYDVAAVLLLCYHVLEFNLQGFFGGKGLASFLPSLSISQ